MNPIDTYLDTAFSSLPATHDAIEARNDIRILMLDKHEELTSQGMSEEEAYEKVVADFGDISEVAYALGLGEFVDGTNPIDNNAIRMDEPRAKAYVEHRASRGRKIGLGVGLIGLSIAVWGATTTYYNATHSLPQENIDFPPTLELFSLGVVALALGVALYLFLSNPYKTEKLFVTKMPLALTRKTKETIVAQREEGKGRQRTRLTLGITLLIVGEIISPLFVGYFYDGTSPLVAALTVLPSVIPSLLGAYLLIIYIFERKAYKALLK
ncbi:MAG: hypothetical protein IKS49_00325 [Actinomycetaceae bacterium]|nr:hypothetical protein [Actinomycetaceae bacterium]